MLAQAVQHLLPGVFPELLNSRSGRSFELFLGGFAQLGDLRFAVLHTALRGGSYLLIDLGEALGELVGLRRRFFQGFV
ncbi:hypothetical protein D3C85_1458990 [compost metagenome]